MKLPDNKIIFFFILFIFAVIIYSPVLNGSFVLDDIAMIVNSSVVKQPINLQKIWAAEYWENSSQTGNYRPMLKQIWFFEGMLFGFQNKTPYIIFNLLLHSLNAFLLFIIINLLLKTDKKISAGAALIYLCHPVNTEFVVNVVGQGEILTVLGMLTAWLFAIYSIINIKHRTFYIVLSAAVVFFSLWVKEQSLLFPAFIVIFYFSYRVSKGVNVDEKIPAFNPFEKNELKRIGLFALLSAAAVIFYIIVRVKVIGSFSPGKIYVPVVFQTLQDNIAFIFYITGRYFILIINPDNLCAQYDWIVRVWKLNKFLNLFSILGVIVSAASLALILIFIKKKKYLVSFLIFSCFFLMAPFLHIIQIGTTIAERHLAHTLCIFCILAAMILNILAKEAAAKPADIKKRITILMVVLVSFMIIGLGAKTFKRAGQWKSGKELWEAETNISEYNYFAFQNYAYYLFSLGNIEDAKFYADKALMVEPMSADAHVTRGAVAAKENDYKRAEMHFKYAIQFGDPHPNAHRALGLLYLQMGREQDGMQELEKAKQLNPDIKL